MASLRKCQKLSPSLIEPIAVGSRLDLQLGDANPIRNSGNTWDNIFQKQKITTKKAHFRGVRICERALQTPRSVKDGKQMLQRPEQRFACILWCRPWWGSCVPVKWMGKEIFFLMPLLKPVLGGGPKRLHTLPLLLMEEWRRCSALPHSRAGVSILARGPGKTLLCW